MSDELTPYQRAMGNFMGDVGDVTYDLGFAPPQVPDTMTELGKAAINLEDLHQSIKDQIDTYLAKAQTGVTMTQGAINNQIYNTMQQARNQVASVQRPIETAIAMQMGKAFEMANQVAPNDSIIRAVVAPEDSTQWTRAAQQAQQVMVSPQLSVVGGIPAPFDPIKPPGGIPVTPVPVPSPTVPTVPSGCMSVEEGTAWLCANEPWKNVPLSDGVHGSQDVLCVVDGKGDKYYTRWVAQFDGVGYPKGKPMYLVIDGPYGRSGFVRPSCTGYTPTPPGVTPVNPIPPVTPLPPDPSHPCPPCPTPIPCPPPETPPCIKICKDEPEDCKETEYQVYCSEGGVLYMVKKDDPPRSSSDKKVASGPGSGLNLASIVKECRQKDESTQPGGYTAQQFQFVPVGGCDGLVGSIGITPPSDGKWIESLLNLKIGGSSESANTGDNVIDALAKWLASKALPGATKSLDNLIEGVVRWLNSAGCGSGTAYATVAGRAISGLASRVLGRATDPVETTLEYSYNSQCPYRLPTSDEATRAYLTNSIDLQRLICLVQANGHRWDTWSQIVDSARTRLNATETLVAWKRGIATDEWAAENLRQLGYLEGPETEILKELTNQIPPMSDLVSMMMRDVADETNIDWSEIDKLFGEKWTGQLKQWGSEQGVPDLYAKYIWRAHFTIPSPTQLAEFWKRLRYKGTLGTYDQTREKIKNALIQQDIAPQWIDSFLEVQHPPLTRVDTRRGYEIGSLSLDDVQNAYLDQGYSDKNAAILTQFAKAQQIERAKRSSLIRRYATGELTFSDLELELEQSGFSPDLIDIATSKAQRELRYRRRKVCLAAIRKRYLLGEIKFPDLRDRIQSEGIDPQQAEEIAKGWECERHSRGKTVPANTLCEWYTKGVISDVDMYTRLLNLGYDQDDAAKLVQSCRVRLGLKLQKDQQKAIADAKKRAIADERAARAAGAHLQNELDKIARATEKRKQTKQRRQRLLLEAAQKFADRNVMSYTDAAIGIQAAVDAAIAGGLSDIDTVYQTAVIAARSEECDSLDCLSRLLGELLIEAAMVPSS